MRRRQSPPGPEEGLRRFMAMNQEGFGPRALLPYQAPGATLEEARCLYKRLGQQSRTPSKLLDERYGVE